MEGLLESIDVTLPSGMLVIIDLANPNRGGELHIKMIGESDTYEKIEHMLTKGGVIWGGDADYHELHLF